MDENTSSTLQYGHVGRAIYTPETSSWSFSRSLTRGPTITYTGVTTTTIQSPRDISKPQTDGQDPESSSRRRIPNAYPDLAVVWPTVNEDAFSQFVASASEFYDPNVGNLLDLGYAVHLVHDDAKTRPGSVMIAAAVTGECRDVISFRALAEGTAELTQESVAVRVPVINDAETTEWSTEGAPIYQIGFAHPTEDDEERTTWMAARLSESTAIFRPCYEQDRAPMHLRRDDPWALPTPPRNSRLNANPVVEILSSYTGGFPHADVAFNPWYQRQLAIVDNRGNWSVWEITGRQKRRKAHWLATPGQTGALPSDDDPKANGPRHDGWASIQWIADYSVLLVADRGCAMLFRIGDSEIRSNSVELNLGRKSEWVLDVQRSTRNLSQFFILTTSRIMWFDLTGVSLDGEAFRSAIRPNLTWRHFRDPEDTSLRCNDLLIGDALHLVLYSRLTELVQVFPFPSSTGEEAESIAVADPFLLHVPRAIGGSNLATPARFSTFVFREVAHSPVSQGKSRYDPDMTLIKIFWIDSSLAVHETLYKGPDRIEQDDDTEVQNNRVLRVKKNQSGPKKDVEIDEDENFIVDDWDESVFGPPQVHIPRASRASPYASLEWTVDWSYIYKFVLKKMTKPGNELWFNQIMQTLEGQGVTHIVPGESNQTLLEISGGQLSSGDIDQSANDLEHLASIVAPRASDSQFSRQFTILPLQFSNLFPGMQITSGQDPYRLDYLETYDRLVHKWLASLPSEIPNPVRVMKEKSIRGIALDLLLSRIVKISDRSTKREATDPYRPTQGSSSQNDAAEDQNAPRSAYNTLSTFTTFKEPRAPPRHVARLLSQWQPGSDPTGYNWQKASILDEDNSQREPRTPKRGRKTRPPQAPAPEAANAARTASLPPTPVAPIIRAWGSQPDQSPSAFLQSSQPTVDEAPMTQTERGQFGTRHVKKTVKPKKKRRAAGF